MAVGHELPRRATTSIERLAEAHWAWRPFPTTNTQCKSRVTGSRGAGDQRESALCFSRKDAMQMRRSGEFQSAEEDTCYPIFQGYYRDSASPLAEHRARASL